MSKIPLLQNKENIITVVILTVLISLVLANVLVLAPSVISVFSRSEIKTKTNPIDIGTLNSAVEILNTP